MIQLDEHIFQMGWFNHQLENLDFWLKLDDDLCLGGPGEVNETKRFLKSCSCSFRFVEDVFFFDSINTANGLKPPSFRQIQRMVESGDCLNCPF